MPDRPAAVDAPGAATATQHPASAAHGLHVHRGTRAVQRMVEYAPSSGGLALWMQHRDLPLPDAGTAAPPGPAAPPPAAQWAATGARPPAPPAFTDGRTVFYTPAFEALPLPRQCGVVAHQVLHAALRHPQRYLALQRLTGDADLQLFNTCADAIVDGALSHLGWLELPQNAVTLDRLLDEALGLKQDLDAALLQWDVERLYRAIDDRRPASGPDGPDSPGARQPDQRPDDRGRRNSDRPVSHPGQADTRRTAEARTPAATAREDGPKARAVRALAAGRPIDLCPDADAAGPPEQQAEEAREWRERLQRAHAGDGALSMLRALLADLPRTRTPWEHALRSQLARGLAQRPAPSWSRPTRSYLANQGRAGPGRRLPWEPGTSAQRPVPRLALVVDVSGSVDDGLLQRFATEIEAISRRLEAPFVLIVGDDQVRRVAHCQPGGRELRSIGFHGGGGTDFTPLLQEAEQHRPDLVVVLTDLQGPAGHRPRCPVLWAVPEAPPPAAPGLGPAPAPSPLTPPFGRLLWLR